MVIFAILIFAAFVCFLLFKKEHIKYVKPLLESNKQVRTEPSAKARTPTTAKEYGIWLLSTGRWRRNKRKRKRLAG